MAVNLNPRDMLTKSIKYFIIFIAVALSTIYIPNEKIDTISSILIGLVASIVFVLIDMYSPSIVIGSGGVVQ